MIGLFFDLLALLIVARILLFFIGYNYGAFYEFVFTYSEKILKPIRDRLPKSKVDWSPFIALILIDTFAKLVDPLVFFIVHGEYGRIPLLIYGVFVSMMSSVAVILIIIFIVKIVNDLVKGQNYVLTTILDSMTEPLIVRVKTKLPFNYRRYAGWLVLALLLATEAFLQHELERINF
jgi:uncharacterized protein YggT (Ycf19 family)